MFLNESFLTPTCIPQNDQRDVALILKNICWGILDPLPPQGLRPPQPCQGVKLQQAAPHVCEHA